MREEKMQISKPFYHCHPYADCSGFGGKKQKLTGISLLAVSASIQLLSARPCPSSRMPEWLPLLVGLEEQRLPKIWKILACWTSIVRLNVWARAASSLAFSWQAQSRLSYRQEHSQCLRWPLGSYSRQPWKLNWLRPALTKLSQQPKKKLKNNLFPSEQIVFFVKNFPDVIIDITLESAILIDVIKTITIWIDPSEQMEMEDCIKKRISVLGIKKKDWGGENYWTL